MTAVGSVAAVRGAPRQILRLEGAALFLLATIGFGLTGLSWWLFVVLFLAPDLGLIGYLAGPQKGAILYNALHSTIAPALLAGCWFLVREPLLAGLAAIWAAHIGFDRTLGYGLKYASAFGDTHLGRIGRRQGGA
ncbi:DUF4260 domain-containing protein [Microvirga rosea]|uniref:DUF4260 domain-containing protein n=1 Tax=Microvirga rosea TaxID=2715425 RepID=UPI001D0A7965|nr:DUF4260 domain-containing protein [Microvirga rosea]MCB8821710.1 DUF4260 domain-containing protein [Microvirga rosea]